MLHFAAPLHWDQKLIQIHNRHLLHIVYNCCRVPLLVGTVILATLGIRGKAAGNGMISSVRTRLPCATRMPSASCDVVSADTRVRYFLLLKKRCSNILWFFHPVAYFYLFLMFKLDFLRCSSSSISDQRMWVLEMTFDDTEKNSLHCNFSIFNF